MAKVIYEREIGVNMQGNEERCHCGTDEKSITIDW